MAFRTTPFAVVAAGLFVLTAADSSTVELTLAQAQSRTGPNLVPAYLETLVTVHGTVATPPVWTIDAYLLGIHDGEGHGFALKGEPSDFAGLSPGDRISASGKITQLGGMAVLTDFQITKSGLGAPLDPVPVSPEALGQLRYLGLLVSTEGIVQEIRHEDAGDSLVLGSPPGGLRYFVPKMRGDVIMDVLSPFRAGDKVRVTGLAVQRCLLPPYDRCFEIIGYERTPVVLLDRPAGRTRWAVALGLLAAALLFAVAFLMNRRRAEQRKAMRSLNALGEEILSAGSASEILVKLAAVIPKVSGATGVRLYQFNRRTRTLDRLRSPEDADPMSINPDAPSGPLATGAALAFRSRTVVNVPDTRRSPLFKVRGASDIPRSVMFAPMFAQEEPMGVLEVDHAGGIRYFNTDEQAVIQHLANQVAACLRLLEQQAVREQLFRSEKLAATAQLISGVAAELSSPLESLLMASHRLLERHSDTACERELTIVAAEAQRASEIVTRLVSFGQSENVIPRIVELNELVSGLTRFREREWKANGIRVQEKLWKEPLHVMGAQGQLEQVFLNILVHAEQSLTECSEKSVSIGSVRMAKRAVVEIVFGCPEGTRDPFLPQSASDSGGTGLAVVRGIVRNHGGDARFSRNGRACTIEVDLPMTDDETPASGAGCSTRNGRTLTTLVVDPEPVRQRRLVKELTRREHRVVPVSRAEEALDLAGRVRFDIVVCSARLPGLNWVEFLERTREQVGAYVLLGMTNESARISVTGGSLLVLDDVTSETEFERVISQAEHAADHPLAVQPKA